MKTTRVILGSLVLSSVALAATDDALRPIAFQNGVNQQALGAETAALAREITTLIEELQRNGFPLQSLNALTELAAQLQALGGTEMSGIAARLRKLGESAQADPRATATEAYVAQQAIETRLKTLARQISIQQLREETARRLEALITRQLAIQRETRAIASAKADAERQRLLESDQSGIGEDLATFFQTGENLLARLRETNTAAPAQSFAERINGALLTTLSTEAVAELKGKRYPTAYGRQESLIAELRKILQGILSSLPKEQRLANALQQVSALLQQQQAADQAQTPSTPEANQQAADQAQNLANQVAPLSPQAAAALQQAQQALQNPQANQPPQNQQSSTQQTPPNQSGSQQAANQQNQPQNGQSPQQAQSQQGQPPQTAQSDSSQQQTGDSQQQQGQESQQNQSAAAAALAAAQAALQNALAQAQQQTGQGQQQGQQNGQQPNQQGQQQAGNQQQPGQPQNGQQQGQQQGQQTAQNGQRQQNGQQGRLTANGQPPGEGHESGLGDAQGQIAGHGPAGKGPAETVGALRREEREAFTALQGERYPAEYSAWVQQYWRNLASDQ